MLRSKDRYEVLFNHLALQHLTWIYAMIEFSVRCMNQPRTYHAGGNSHRDPQLHLLTSPLHTVLQQSAVEGGEFSASPHLQHV